MDIEVKCNHCNNFYDVDETHTGQEIECPECGKKFIIAPHNTDQTQPAEHSPEAETEDDLILGLYRLEGEVAEGGMGKVFKVHHTTWNVDLAMKQPHAHMFETEEQKETFSHECEAWINLGLHPHIVSCYYVREIDGVPNIFAEWMEGGDLSSWMESGKLYEGEEKAVLERILDIAIQFAWGLDYAHEQGLIHQDVKPKNVMLTPEEDVKIADFGIANAKRDLRISSSITTNLAGTMISDAGAYTPEYAAPEQIAGKPLTRRTDIFSWAVSMVEILIGGRVWQGSSATVQHSFDDYLDSATVPVPEKLKELLRECLQEDESKRPHDFKIIAEQLLSEFRMLTGDDYYRETPKSATDTPDTLNNRALSYLDMKRPELAEQMWEKALQSAPMHLESTYNQGLHLWRSATIDDLELIKRIESLEQHYSDTWRVKYLLAIIHLDRSDANAAKPFLKTALEVSDNEPEVEEVLKRMDRLGNNGQCLYEPYPSNVNAMYAFSKEVIFLATDYKNDVIIAVFDEEKQEWGGVSLTDLPDRHTDTITSLCFNPVSRNLYTAGWDRKIKGWSREGGLLRNITISDNCPAIRSMAISMNENALIGCDDPILRLWNIKTDVKVQANEKHNGNIDAVCISNDGLYGLSGSWDKTVKFWCLESGHCLHTFREHMGLVHSVCLSPNAKLAVSGSSDMAIKLWDTETGKCIRTFLGHRGGVTSVCFNHDGKYILSGSRDKTMKLWDIESGQCLRSFEGHKEEIVAVSYNLFGKASEMSENKLGDDLQLFSAGDGIKQWSLPYIQSCADFELCQITSSEIIFDKDKRFKAVLDEAVLNYEKDNIGDALIRVEEAQGISTVHNDSQCNDLKYAIGRKCKLTGIKKVWQERSMDYGGRVNSACFSPDGKYVLAAGVGDAMKIWNVETGGMRRISLLERGNILSACFSPDGKYILSADRNEHTARLWDSATGQYLFSLKGEHKYEVQYLSFSPDGKLILTAGTDRTFKLWDIETRICLHSFDVSVTNPYTVDFSPDGKNILSSQELKLWDTVTGECLRVLDQNNYDPFFACFSPDGKFVLSTGKYKRFMNIWKITSGELVRSIEDPLRKFYGAGFSPDGKYAISRDKNEKIKLWNLDSGKCLHSIEEHLGDITSVCFSPDGKYILSGSLDNTLKLCRLDWEYEFPGWADWDDGVEPYLRNFLTLRNNQWNDDDFNCLVNDLQNRGYGWLRLEGVRKKLEELTIIIN